MGRRRARGPGRRRARGAACAAAAAALPGERPARARRRSLRRRGPRLRRSPTTTPGSRHATATRTSRGCAPRWAKTCSLPWARPSRRCSATHGSRRWSASSTTGVQVFIGSGVGDLARELPGRASLERATRAWNHFWAQARPLRRAASFRGRANAPPGGRRLPTDPASLPVDSEERCDALGVWDAYWAARSDELRAASSSASPTIERMAADDEDHEKAHLNAIRKRVRAHRALVEEVGCPPPPWTAVSPNLIWNIQNAPAAQVTMLLDVHGAAWAPVGACSTFGVALKCGRDAILRGEAKMAIVGTTDPRPDAALVGAFHGARHAGHRRGEHAVHVAARHARLGRVVRLDHRRRRCGARRAACGRSAATSRPSRCRRTPSTSSRPPRAVRGAPSRAPTRRRESPPSDVALIDLHATGTPGDLNELALVEEFIGRAHADHGAQGPARARHGQLRRLGADRARPRPRARRGAADRHRRGRRCIPASRSTLPS